MTPSTKKIILTDYPAFLLTIAAPLSWLLLAGAFVIGGMPNRSGEFISFGEIGFIMLAIAIIVTVVTVPLLLRRIESYKNLLLRGRDATGVITSVWFVKDRGRVEYDVDFQGQRLHAWNAIMKKKETLALRVGDSVGLAVDANDPRRALIRHLYSV